MKRRMTAVLAAVVVTTVLMPAAPGVASANGPSAAVTRRLGAAERAKLVDEFVDRIESRWGFRLDASNYAARVDQSGDVMIEPVGAPVRSSTTTDDDRTSVAFSTATVAPKIRPLAKGDMSIQQETIWWQPTCWERVSDPYRIGYIDACSQWGNMNYAGATRANYAFRMWASCGALDGGPDFRQVDTCFVRTMPSRNAGPMVWTDWSPKSTSNLSSCASVGLSIGVGPVTASASVNTCEKLVPEKGAYAGYMKATWEGKSYYGSDVRETGLLIGIGPQTGFGGVSLDIEYRFTWRECTMPPSVGWWCAI